MSTLRTAVVGYGLAGRVFHCPFVSAIPGLELAAVVQRRGDEAAHAYPGVHIARSAEEVLNDPAIDLIVVATPNATHFDLATAALAAGKHVVIDKPFATTSEDALRLIEHARRAGKILAPFHNRRYDGDFLTVRKLLAESALGRIVRIDSTYDRYRPLQRPGTWKETGGAADGINGLLFDLGPHLVDQALALFGTPQSITANSRVDRDHSEIDDSMEIALDYGGSEDVPYVRYVCRATMLAAEPAPRFRVNGTHGSFVKFGLDPQEAALLKGAKPPRLGEPAPWLPEPESAWGTLTLATKRAEPVEVERKPYPTVTGDYRHFYAGVRDAILGTAPLPIPTEDGYRVIRLLELARKSSEMRQTLPVTFPGLD